MTSAISVVVCSHSEDRWSWLLTSLASLQRQTVGPAEVVLAVDHNRSLLARARRELPGVVLADNRQAPGLSGARNAGLAACSSEIVAFLDDDAEAAPDWIAELLAAYTGPRVVGVGGWVEPVWEHGRPCWFPTEFDWVVGCSYTGLPETTASMRNLIGCNMSFRREVLREAGGFDPRFGRRRTQPTTGQNNEETELCIRVRRLWPGCELLLTPHARVFHHVPSVRASWRYYMSRCFSEGRSKRQLTHAVGIGDGLSTERPYALRTLPRGLAANFATFLLHGRPAGLARAAATMLGLAATTAGYAIGYPSVSGWA